MKFKLIALSLCMIASANVVKGQEYGKDVSTTENKHEIRLSVSDGLTLGSADILGIGLSDAITGSKRTNQSNSMVYGIGYRYALNRFRLGGDLGFAQSSSQLTLGGEKTPSIKEKELNFLILPTAEFVYYKRRLVELYGTAAAGVNLVCHTEKGLSEAGKAAARQTDLSTSFAYQINPIALRVGNDHIGGFLEAMDSPAFLCLYPKQGMVRRPERTGQASFPL